MSAILDDLAVLLREAATIDMLPRFGRSPARTKQDGSLVTAVDLAVQARLIAALERLDATIPVLGEEMEPAAQEALLDTGEGRFWALDPLDGTSNFACGFPGFAISLALFEAGRVRLGVVLDPVRDECFMAERGAGAWLNGAPLQPFAPGPALADGLAMIDSKRLPGAHLVRLFGSGAFRSQRNLGSVALDWCWLAAGRYQMYLHGAQKLWDYAAGRLIASEAGAATALFRTGGATPDEQLDLAPRIAIAAANQDLFAHWLAFVGPPLDAPSRA